MDEILLAGLGLHIGNELAKLIAELGNVILWCQK